jgi:hypothetical protein
MCRCISATTLLPYLPCYYPLHIILFLHLLSINHKCIQPCYFPMLYKPTTQKVKMVMKNSLMRSSRLCAAPVAVPMELWSLPLFCFAREPLSLWRHYLYNKYTLFMTFGYLWTLYVNVCGINDLGHTCDEYLVLLAKSGMTVGREFKPSNKMWLETYHSDVVYYGIFHNKDTIF